MDVKSGAQTNLAHRGRVRPDSEKTMPRPARNAISSACSQMVFRVRFGLCRRNGVECWGLECLVDRPAPVRVHLLEQLRPDRPSDTSSPPHMSI
eukprot:2747259-Rhodomonas_salina.1